MEAAAAGTVPVARRGCTERELTLRSRRRLSLPCCGTAASPFPSALCRHLGARTCASVCVGTEQSATGPQLQGGGCWLFRKPAFS